MAAKNVFRLNEHNMAFYVMGLLSLVLLMQGVGATQFKVGGSYGWAVPSNPDALNQWAEKNRFQVGDSLLFVYRTDTDSLLQVTMEDYNSCNTNKPIAKFKDGSTSFKLYKSGTYYFISGNRENCLKSEKMIAIVMAHRGSSSGASTLSLTFVSSIGAFIGSSILFVL